MAGKFSYDWDKLKEDIVKADSKKGFQKDERFWKPTLDKDTKTGMAIFRFIPDAEGTPFVKLYHHSFDYMVDGQKKYWIKNCVNTFGYDRDCPVCKKNMEYYNSAFESDKAIAAKRGRKQKFIANIYMVSNPGNPEDNGKVFLYEFGVKVYEKVKGKMFPSDTDLADPDFISFIPFDLYDGADFKLKITRQGDFPNYSTSEFSPQKPLLGGDDKKLEKVLAQTHLLSEFMAEDKFPTNAETLTQLGSLLGMSAAPTQQASSASASEIEDISTSADEIPDFGSTAGDAGVDDDEQAFFNSLKKK